MYYIESDYICRITNTFRIMEEKQIQEQTKKEKPISEITPLSDETIIKKIAFKLFQVKSNLEKIKDVESIKILNEAEKILLNSTNLKFPTKEKEQLLQLAKIIS